MIRYRLAATDDFERIQTFLRLHWRSDHIFVRDSAFFRFEMCATGAPQYLLAEAGDKLAGLVGFLTYGKDPGGSDLFIAILRSLPEYAAEGVGLRLLQGVQQLTRGRVSCVGVIPKALPLYNLVGFRTGYLDQFVWVNPTLEAYKILKDVLPQSWQMDTSSLTTVRPLGPGQLEASFTQLDQKDAPQKSLWYFKRRYLEHPVYRYRIQGVFEGESPSARLTGVGVWRIQPHDGASVAKIIDWIGPLAGFPAFLRSIQAACLEEGCEGADLYCTGIAEQLITDAGFRRAEGSAVFPNYFNPYLARNVPVTFATTAAAPFRMFRGDGDQDRPS